MVLVIYVVILLGITTATEIESVALTDNIGETRMTAFVRARLRPGLAGTPLAENNALLHILAAYLISPYLPTRPLFYGVSPSIQYVQVSTDTRTVVTIDADHRTIRTWDLHTGACTHVLVTNTFTHHAHATTRYVIFDSIRVINMGDMGYPTEESSQVWDLYTGTRVAMRPKSVNIFTNRIISDDKQVAVIVSSRMVYMWHWASNSQVEHLEIRDGRRCLISNDNRVLVVVCYNATGDENLHIYRINDDRSIIYANTLRVMNAYIGLSVSIAIQQHLIGVFTADDTIHIWNWENGGITELCTDYEMEGCAFSTDCAFMAIVGGNKVILWKVATRTLLIKLYVGMTAATECMFYGNNSVLLITSNHRDDEECALDVSYLYYNDPLTMQYQFFRTLIERGYVRVCFQKLKYNKDEN